LYNMGGSLLVLRCL
nr:immunoglobulin heavy chain junction region [Mus musculus]